MSVCVTSTCVSSIPCSSTICASGSSTPFESTITPCVPSETRYAFEVHWGCSTRSISKADHAPDPVLALHQLEALVHVVERQPVRDERLDVDLAREPPLHERRHAVAALDPAERRARDAPARDQETRDDVERLALAGNARDRAQAPSHPRRLHRLPHHAHVARRLERVVRAE